DGIRDRNVTGVQTCALPISFSCITPSKSYDCSADSHECISELLCSGWNDSFYTQSEKAGSEDYGADGEHVPGHSDKRDRIRVEGAERFFHADLSAVHKVPETGDSSGGDPALPEAEPAFHDYRIYPG